MKDKLSGGRIGARDVQRPSHGALVDSAGQPVPLVIVLYLHLLLDRRSVHAAAAHTVDPRQYTKLNAIAGMLETGLVRQIADEIETAKEKAEHDVNAEAS